MQVFERSYISVNIGGISNDFCLLLLICACLFSHFSTINIYILYNAKKKIASESMIFPAFVGKQPFIVFEKQRAICSLWQIRCVLPA